MITDRIEHDISLRATIIFMKSPYGGSHSATQIRKILGNKGPCISAINTIYKRACARGFNPKSEYYIIKDDFRSGRPLKKSLQH
jgi:hypothetical protein